MLDTIINMVEIPSLHKIKCIHEVNGQIFAFTDHDKYVYDTMGELVTKSGSRFGNHRMCFDQNGNFSTLTAVYDNNGYELYSNINIDMFAYHNNIMYYYDTTHTCINFVNGEDDVYTSIMCSVHHHNPITSVHLDKSKLHFMVASFGNKKPKTDVTVLNYSGQKICNLSFNLRCTAITIDDGKIAMVTGDNIVISDITGNIINRIHVRVPGMFTMDKPTLMSINSKKTKKFDHHSILVYAYPTTDMFAIVHCQTYNRTQKISLYFALMVLVCDNYFKHHSSNRFFNIITKLPMELQMRIAHLLIGSNKNNVSSTNFNYALRQILL